VARSASLLDPFFWVQAVSAVPDEVRGIGVLARSWWGFAQETAGWSRIAAGFATILAIVVGAGFAGQWLRRRQPAAVPGAGRFAKAVAGLRVLAQTSLAVPLVAAAIVVALDAFGLMPARILEIVRG